MPLCPEGEGYDEGSEGSLMEEVLEGRRGIARKLLNKRRRGHSTADGARRELSIALSWQVSSSRRLKSYTVCV